MLDRTHAIGNTERDNARRASGRARPQRRPKDHCPRRRRRHADRRRRLLTARRRGLHGRGRHLGGRCDAVRHLGVHLQGAAAEPGRGRPPERGLRRRELPPAGRGPRARPCARGSPDLRVQPGPAASDHPGPVDGRALVPGARLGLSRSAARRRAAPEVLPPLHDRGRHGAARQGARARRRRRRAPGDRDGTPPRRERPRPTTSARPPAPR